MDEIKLRAGEKLEALQEAAKTAAGNGKSKVQDVASQAVEAIRKVREAFMEIWHNELISESRARVSAWTRDAVQRIKDGTPPLSPLLLYEELVALFRDRVWRRSLVIFACGAVVGLSCGLAVGLRAGAAVPQGPHARALISHNDQAVILVDDAVAPAASSGEVLIRVQAFSVSPVDRCVLRGRGAALRSLAGRGPVSVGRGFAGVVLDVGPGVSELELGDEVWGCVSEWAGGAGAELLTLRSSRVSKRPRGLSADGAAALPWAGAVALSALRALRYSADSAKGKRIAIVGAASGEGCVLVQLLSAWGAHLTVSAAHSAATTLTELGAHEFVPMEPLSSWSGLEAAGARLGPWDGVLACAGAPQPPARAHNAAALLKSTAPRRALVDIRPLPLLTDRLPAPLSLLFGAAFYTIRVIRWISGCGTHTDWLEDGTCLTPGLTRLAGLVDDGTVAPVLDKVRDVTLKVYLPQDFENALAHACSDDALGTTYCAGVVLDVGPGVSELELGDEVWGCVSEWAGGAGAELLTLRSSRVSKRPRGLSADGAAALPWAGAVALSALRALRYSADSAKGKRIAIVGAASGEGCVLVQLLSAWGAHLTVSAAHSAATTLTELGAHEFVPMEPLSSWSGLEAAGARLGPWDGVLACAGAPQPPARAHNAAALLKSTAPRRALVDIRPLPLLTDRLPAPLSLLFGAAFYTIRVIRWISGCGTHTDWLEDGTCLTPGLTRLAGLVDDGTVAPVLDKVRDVTLKVYLPQDFENALAHACSDDALGTTVIRFP